MSVFLDMTLSLRFLWSLLTDEQRELVNTELNIRSPMVHKMLRTLKQREEVVPA